VKHRLQTRYRPSLRVAIGVPFALLFAATVALQAYTQYDQIDQLIDRSGTRVLDALTTSSRSRLTEFLDEPFRINRDLSDAIARHALYKSGDLAPLYHHLRGVYRDLYLERQQISVLSFGSRDGDYAGIRREVANTGFSLMLKDNSTQGRLTIYKGDRPGAVAATFANYDPRVRPWYAPAAQSGRSAWSAIYTNYDERAEITISAMSPVTVGPDIVGVMATDVKLDGLNRFLQEEPLRGRGVIFITDLEGRLVAQSEPGSVVSEGAGYSKRGERVPMSASASPLIRAAALPVTQAPTESSAGFKQTVGSELYFGRVTPYSDARGLDWRIVALVPESDLIGDIRLVSERAMLWILGFAVIGLFLGLWVIRWVSGAIHQTASAANKLALGEWNTSLDQVDSLKETTTLVQAFNEMATRLQKSFDHMREQLTYDSLTHVLTRRGLLEQANWRDAKPGVLCLVGLDAFRAINDNVGHGTGDRLLQAIAERMQAQFAATVRVARVGGDEFALLFLDADAGPQALAFGEQALAVFTTPFCFGSDEVLLTASVGVVEGQLQADALPEWLRNASVALGAAKRQGRGQCVVFEAGLLAQSVARARLANELRQALEKEQFLVFYQPVIDLVTGRVTGAEALVRWQSPERGLVSPALFIPVAEESDLILALGEWVLRTATRDIGQRQSPLPADFELHVNLSPRQLIQSNFVTTLQQALQDSGLPAHHLTLELTESQLIKQDGVTENRLRDIRAMGIKIAIDDFGTGYSSLAYLSGLPFDCLKIDQSFVRKLCNSVQDAAIVMAVLHIAEGFGVSVVAEGVETLAEAQSLRTMGCRHVQGYYFGRPGPLAQLDWHDRPALPP
jgi:diguanylate cyclase (GGDEF)-like protein